MDGRVLDQDGFRSREGDGTTAAPCLSAILHARAACPSILFATYCLPPRPPIAWRSLKKMGENASSDTRRFLLRYRRIPGAAAAIRSGFTRLCRLPAHSFNPHT